jgi:hypothetical protein
VIGSGFDPGALLARSYSLPRGPRVCLRLARPRDAAGIADLYWSHGHEPDELELARLVRFDPRRRIVIAATALLDSVERVVGVGAIDLDDGSTDSPSFVLVDEHLTEGLEQLLSDALVGRAGVLTRGRAA